MEHSKSKKLFERAKKVIPGGVNSPVRAFRSVGMDPVFIKRAEGAYLYDADGNKYIDHISSWGPMILGHGHPEVVDAVAKALKDGASFGAPTEAEVTLAEMVVEAVPSVEEVRMVSSGTEAVMSAIRLARAYTGRPKILKFEGCYHGHSDSLLVKAGSGVATLGLPDSPGVTEGTAGDTLTVPYNDLPAVEQALDEAAGQVACIIIEPVAGNMGVVLPKPGFLEGLRALADKNGALLVFDEVISGFRAAYGGAQSVYKVWPDLTTLGKTIGGGLPVGAFGGRKEIMEMIAPAGPVYQAGTLSGNPLAMAAGIATLSVLKRGGVYEDLQVKSERLAAGTRKAAADAGVAVTVNQTASVMTCFFTPDEVTDYASAKKADTAEYGAFFRQLIEQGVYYPPSQFEAVFVSLAHTGDDIEQSIAAAGRAFNGIGA
ncbi:MAG: glutamate-1-semialdehyde 2,1-aminomutase [Actinomycetota bacterium]